MDSNSSSIKFNVANIKLNTKTEGPYSRCCIWFQGCDIHCPGCCNFDLQKLAPKHIVSEDKLLEIVKEAKNKYGIEGITLSGGEPSIQKGLTDFNKKVRELGLGIIIFSGRYKNELDSNLVSSVDLLIDGPYIDSKHDFKRLLLGSTNKRLNFITDRYKDKADYFENEVALEEINIEDGYLFVNGD